MGCVLFTLEMSKKLTQSESDENLSVEQSIARLEEIVAAMEDDHLPLEEVIEHYREGASLIKSNRERIHSVRKEVEKISLTINDRESDAVQLDPFDS